jgi:hypothetical protein
VRNALWSHPQAEKAKPAWLLDLFPAKEFPFCSHLQPLIRPGTLRTCRTAFLKEQIAAASDLFVVAHGRANGLVDAEGNHFDLPVSHPMPARIWLLACNVCGAMDKLAAELIAGGCKTVITATGDLSAPEMGAVINEWFNEGKLVESPEHWLGRLKAEGDIGDGGVHSLTVWGEVSVDRSSCAPWNRRAWMARHGDDDGLQLDDQTSLAEFQEAYAHAMSPLAWQIARDDMLVPLLWLAEKHHHPAMEGLERLVGDRTSPAAINALASASRRAGNYVAMANYLSQGLALPNLAVIERTDYLGALANLLIDLDLPNTAKTAIDQHQDCEINDHVAAQLGAFKRLDWLARVEARRGRFHVALSHLATKRSRVLPDEGRELAGQLYLATWGHLAGQIVADESAAFAKEAAERLECLSRDDIGHGNDTSKYLLRALAAYGWAMKDEGALEHVMRWRMLAVQRLAEFDPGPWAYLLAYLHLAGQAPKADFECAIESLERARYYLEAAMLAGFSGDQANGHRLLVRFHGRRNGVLAALEGKRAAMIEGRTVLVEAADRAKIEMGALGNILIVAQRGVLPL